MSTLSKQIETTLSRASALHASGRLAEAESLYRELLDVPSAPKANLLHLLGLTALQQGRAAEAMSLGDKVIALQPGNAAAHALRGFAALAMGSLEAAVGYFDKSLKIQPDLIAALQARSGALKDLERFDAAVADYDRILRLVRPSPSLLLDRAEALQRAGHAGPALEGFEAVLSSDPNSETALFGRAAALRALRRLEEAAAAYQLLISRAPNYFEAHHNLGTIQMELGLNEAAIDSFDRALALNPPPRAAAQSLHNRANALHRQNRDEEALTYYDRALRIDENLVEARIARGVALAALGRHQAALTDHEHALRLDERSVFGLVSRGNALLKLGRHEEALTSYDRALALQPANADAHNGRGMALRNLWRLESALQSFEAAVAADPGHAVALNNCGLVLRDLRRLRDAIPYLERAVALNPRFAGALANLGYVLQSVNRTEESARCFAQVIEIDPEFEDALGSLFLARITDCDWSDYESLQQRVLKATLEGKRAADPLTFQAISGSPGAQLTCARAHCDVMDSSWHGTVHGHERLRIAYLSADFRDHPVAHLSVGVYERHDRDRFETYGISLRKDQRQSALRERLERAFDHFHEVSRESDRSILERLRALKIDIAVDLTGHTAGRRPGILGRRAAPVQVNYLGFTGTTGADHIDYLIADSVAIPHGTDRFYSERIVRLPYTYLPNDDRQPIASDVLRRSDAGLPDDTFVYCAFNNPVKYTPAMFKLWMGLLERTPGSVLWLRAQSPAMTANLRREAERLGIAPGRLVFAPPIKAMDQHLARHRLADLFLDTFPYNAHATSHDALWAGLPVLTCLGEAFASRVAGSLLLSLELPELVTANLDEYTAAALRFARNPAGLAGLRERLAHNKLARMGFDTELYCRHLESAYLTMCARSRRGEPPASFDVEPLA